MTRPTRARAGQLLRPLAAVACLALAMSAAEAQAGTIRIGHFSNITHVQALVAHHLTRQGKGWFEDRLGPGVTIEWFVYNAGPSAMEAIFANSIDLMYVGPNPAINAYAKSRGAEIRIVAGAANGGAALVVQPDSQLRTASDFRGKKVATPQLGNTQDVAARAWLVAGGLKITQTGGDAHVLPTANPDQLALFKQKQLDAVWTVEPWVSRLELEAQARVLVEEADAITTVVAASVKFLGSNRDTLRRFVAAHRELTDWIKANPADAQRMVRQELAAETRTSLPAEVVERACKRIVVTSEVSREALDKFMANAQSGVRPIFLSWSRSPDAHTQTHRGPIGDQACRPGRDCFRTPAATVQALDDLSLDVADAEFVCLVGPSGCGKTTLLDIIAGLTKPDKGRVLADGQAVEGPGRQRLVMFQESALFPWLTVLGNVMFGLKLRGGLTNSQRREIAQEHLELVGLEKFAHANVHELSGGVKQRVALARALAPDPRVLLMDEPLASLDALTREQLYGDIQRIWAARHKTIILVTHNVREAVCLGDRVILLTATPGRIREQFPIALPRPRDINSAALSNHAAQIIATLKGYMAGEVAE